MTNNNKLIIVPITALPAYYCNFDPISCIVSSLLASFSNLKVINKGESPHFCNLGHLRNSQLVE